MTDFERGKEEEADIPDWEIIEFKTRRGKAWGQSIDKGSHLGRWKRKRKQNRGRTSSETWEKLKSRANFKSEIKLPIDCPCTPGDLYSPVDYRKSNTP